MTQLDVADDVNEQVALLGRAWATSASEVVRRLLVEFRGADGASTPAKSATSQVAVHAIYGSTRTDGFYDPVTQALTITTGPLAGKAFRKPSGAAVAIVGALGPGVSPNRNGWFFWVVSETGRRLQSIRSEPRACLARGVTPQKNDGPLRGRQAGPQTGGVAPKYNQRS